MQTNCELREQLLRDESWREIASTLAHRSFIAPPLRHAIEGITVSHVSTVELPKVVLEWTIIEARSQARWSLTVPPEFVGRRNLVAEVAQGWGDKSTGMMLLYTGQPEQEVFVLKSHENNGQEIAYIPTNGSAKIYLPDRRDRLTTVGCATIVVAAIDNLASLWCGSKKDDVLQQAFEALGEETYGFYVARHRTEAAAQIAREYQPLEKARSNGHGSFAGVR